MHAYTLIASFVHGNALGVVLEPRIATENLDKELLPSTWQARIDPLTVEADFGTQYPKEDYDAVGIMSCECYLPWLTRKR